jgi:hypothetical protein
VTKCSFDKFENASKVMFWKWLFKACALFQKFHHVFEHHPMIVFNILCYRLGVSPWFIRGNKWTFFLFFCLSIAKQPIHMCYPLCLFVGCPSSWFLIVHLKGQIYDRFQELAMVVLFARKSCPKLNATMHFQSCIELLAIAR